MGRDATIDRSFKRREAQTQSSDAGPRQRHRCVVAFGGPGLRRPRVTDVDDTIGDKRRLGDHLGDPDDDGDPNLDGHVLPDANRDSDSLRFAGFDVASASIANPVGNRRSAGGPDGHYDANAISSGRRVANGNRDKSLDGVANPDSDVGGQRHRLGYRLLDPKSNRHREQHADGLADLDQYCPDAHRVVDGHGFDDANRHNGEHDDAHRDLRAHGNADGYGHVHAHQHGLGNRHGLANADGDGVANQVGISNDDSIADRVGISDHDGVADRVSLADGDGVADRVGIHHRYGIADGDSVGNTDSRANSDDPADRHLLAHAGHYRDTGCDADSCRNANHGRPATSATAADRHRSFAPARSQPAAGGRQSQRGKCLTERPVPQPV
jgi:hypothetical protein